MSFPGLANFEAISRLSFPQTPAPAQYSHTYRERVRECSSTPQSVNLHPLHLLNIHSATTNHQLPTAVKTFPIDSVKWSGKDYCRVWHCHLF
ncbi:hypothetical protein EYC84_008955 [Monilinia fructicola]|uniref:Uncharacterized protein n=1 Tax=Monilinia fructicola TaxID=38448 RepID=A0A5M9JEY6_MONFR|nr:hypothetical protein EYC84_008955 [Monilinia fructicola]